MSSNLLLVSMLLRVKLAYFLRKFTFFRVCPVSGVSIQTLFYRTVGRILGRILGFWSELSDVSIETSFYTTALVFEYFSEFDLHSH